ncbi:MAG TPA: competence/damage-inducible protein A, partial [Verrucomicrobiota bacterium]|nr:competence/damage-inducible protein A [Verrucomicrobiota bacterium]
MTIEIINTGSELLNGSVLNTHQQWLCNKLYGLGYRVSRQITVPDTAEDIKTAALDSVNRADVIIITGGLGPTSDDETRDVIAEMFGRKLVYDKNVADQIKDYFALRKREQPESTKIQAYVPEGAVVLPNQFGTAPGIVIETMVKTAQQPRKVLLIMLPGPPRELYPMFENQVIPLLKEKVPLPN